MADLGTITIAQNDISALLVPILIDSYTASETTQHYGTITAATAFNLTAVSIDTYGLGGTSMPYIPPTVGQLYPN